jgi:hypothetical protein
MPQLSQQQSSPLASMIVALLIYGGGAAFFLYLGVSSIRCRRWVRPIVLSIMWPTLVAGITVIIATLAVLPSIFDNIDTHGSTGLISPTFIVAVVVAVVGVVVLVGYIGLPLAHILAYRSESVKLTLEAVDTRTRWTDRHPIPLLGVAVWIVLSAVMMLGTVGSNFTMIAGFLVTGPAALGIALVQLAVSLLLAKLVLQRRKVGLYGTVLYLFAIWFANGVGMHTLGMENIYRLTGTIPDQQIAMMAPYLEPLGLFTLIISVLSVVAASVYLIFIRKLFNASPPGPLSR